MNESILNSIKKGLGIVEEYDFYDSVIIMHINSVFAILSQIGVGPEDGFSIVDDSTIWNEYLEDDKLLNDVKSYITLKVSMLFDPPANSTIKDAKNSLISELEFRINVHCENKEREK